MDPKGFTEALEGHILQGNLLQEVNKMWPRLYYRRTQFSDREEDDDEVGTLDDETDTIDSDEDDVVEMVMKWMPLRWMMCWGGK
ncbi:hypothetical protein E2562_014717 [Oryza meyeriana var. granulata]|uniref:Uncharacterized protein n=1 Tax=Oryza meyeriana var. granulata TaxID=110450 RepID=A0A6G1BKL5_9ORYZ|nr:hypothetical protein E2562_014717 [Oryza meyeriana var. granulata]